MDDGEIRHALERHHEESWGWALSCCRGDPEEAEEVLQSAYLEVLEGRARFGGRSRFRTWLFGVIRHTAAGRRRRRLLRSALLLRRRDDLPALAPAPRPDEAAAEGVAAERLRAALGELSQRQREVLMLTFYHGMTIEAAGELLGISLGSARTHHHRGKARLRELLAGKEGR